MPMPPPPPPGGLFLGESKRNDFKPSPAGGDGHGLLLDSIRKGTKLKKTETVDKSAPAIGKVVGNQSTSGNAMTQNIRPVAQSNTGSTGANGQPLAGIFANGMPKLKPVGSRSKGTQSSNMEQNKKSASAERDSPPSGYKPTSNGSSQHMKTKSNVETNIRFNNAEIKRGPPPQPPVQKAQMPLSASDSIIAGLSPNKNTNAGSTASLSSNYSNSSLTKTSKTNSVTNLSQSNAPNQSSLFANKSNLHASLSSLNQNNKLSTIDHGSSTASLVSQKTVINHGKPNLAPKPPSLNTSAKPSVMRAHSMRSPRTPPITPPGVLPFGTLRGPPAGFHQSQDSIKMKPAPPVPPMGRPNIPPPIRPPANRPPPPPSRSTSSPAQNANTATSPRPVNNNNSTSPNVKPVVPNKLVLSSGGSNSSALGPPNGGASPAKPALNFMSGINNASMGVPPPPPPHRTQPAPPPPTNANRLPVAVTNAVAPTPPVRNSSMRNCNGNTGTNISAVILDLETRFSDMFHSVNELPFPIHFCELRKTYNSKNHLKQTQQNMVNKQQSFSKPQAPLPPMQTPTIQLGRKMYSDDSTDC